MRAADDATATAASVAATLAAPPSPGVAVGTAGGATTTAASAADTSVDVDAGTVPGEDAARQRKRNRRGGGPTKAKERCRREASNAARDTPAAEEDGRGHPGPTPGLGGSVREGDGWGRWGVGVGMGRAMSLSWCGWETLLPRAAVCLISPCPSALPWRLLRCSLLFCLPCSVCFAV